MISESVKSDIFSNDIEKYIKSASTLNGLSGKLITKAKLSYYNELCFLPGSIMRDITNGGPDEFKKAVIFFDECGSQLINKQEFEEYDKKYKIPDNIKIGIKSDILEQYQKAAVYIGNIDYINLKAGDLKILDINGEKFEFVWIPPGSVRLGLFRSHCTAVITKGFWLGKYPLTEKQWKAVTGHDPYETVAFRVKRCDNKPVQFVAYEKIMKNFMPVINSLFEGCGRFRLPTEAEWEYACRAGTQTLYYWGNEMDDGCCWYEGNSNEVMSVGLLKPNAWGLYDMSGNVSELCCDKYGAYPKGIVMDPVGKNSGFLYSARGGAYSGSADNCRSGARFGAKSYCGYDFVGARIVFEPIINNQT